MRISATEINSFVACRRQWDYSSPNRQNLERKLPAHALWFGTGIHAALAEYYLNKIPPYEYFAKWIKEQFNELQKSGMAEESADEMLDDAKAMAIPLLESYVDFANRKDNFSVKEIEKEYEIPIADTVDGKLVGRLDGLIEDKNEAFWVLEHKTFSQHPPEDFELFDIQTALYQLAAQHLFGTNKSPVRGVCYNAIRKKIPLTPDLLQNGTLSKKKIATTKYAYIKTIDEHGFDRMDYQDVLAVIEQEESYYFFRHWIRRTTDELKQVQEFLTTVHNQMCNKDIAIYPSPNHKCTYMCSYKDICLAQSTGIDTSPILETQYQQRPQRGAVYTNPQESEG